MLMISKSESIAIRKVHPAAEIQKTKSKKYYVPEEKRYLKILAQEDNDEAQEILCDRNSLDLKI